MTKIWLIRQIRLDSGWIWLPVSMGPCRVFMWNSSDWIDKRGEYLLIDVGLRHKVEMWMVFQAQLQTKQQKGLSILNSYCKHQHRPTKLYYLRKEDTLMWSLTICQWTDLDMGQITQSVFAYDTQIKWHAAKYGILTQTIPLSFFFWPQVMLLRWWVSK